MGVAVVEVGGTRLVMHTTSVDHPITYIVFTAAATIYFITQFCAASIRERLLFESGVY